MRKISVEEITGIEVLAKDIYGQNDNILLLAGTKIKFEYKDLLKRLNIVHIYVEDEISEGINQTEMTEVHIQELSLQKVKNTLEKYSYNSRAKEEELVQIAEDVIDEILGNENVLYSISGVRDKNKKLYEHSLNVCVLSVVIALKLELSLEKVKEIAIGSILHDIGYCHVSVNLDEVGYQKLSFEEQKEVKRHVIYGYNIVEKETWLKAASKEIILSHHEMCNGKGYPFGLKEGHLKIGPKIVSLCNEFDHLIYGHLKPQMKVHEAIEYLVSQSGVKFDADVVKVFQESIAAYPNGTIVLTSENEVGIVLRQNSGFPTRPVIRIIEDEKGNKLTEWVEKDLTTYLSVFIEDTKE